MPADWRWLRILVLAIALWSSTVAIALAQDSLLAPLSSDLPPPSSMEVPPPIEQVGSPQDVDGFLRTETVKLAPADCEATNRSLWIVVGAVNIGAVVLFFVILWLASHKGWWGSGLARFAGILVPVSAIAATVVATYRPAADTVGKCLDSGEFRHLILLGDLDGWLRGIVLGFVPVLVVCFLLKIVHHVATR